MTKTGWSEGTGSETNRGAFPASARRGGGRRGGGGEGGSGGGDCSSGSRQCVCVFAPGQSVCGAAREAGRTGVLGRRDHVQLLVQHVQHAVRRQRQVFLQTNNHRNCHLRLFS